MANKQERVCTLVYVLDSRQYDNASVYITEVNHWSS